jgi:DNA-binding transcriptional LysR family regulator
MKNDINFRHLFYFWVVAKEGGITRAAERLNLAVQTISSQLTLLEQSLGKTLFSQQGRRLVLTEAGRLALGYADQIFLLGEQMQEALNEADSGRIRLTVGISDSLPKLSAYRMLEAAMAIDKKVHLVCYEDQFEALLADLALHKLDVVLTDREVPSGSAMKVFSHRLFDSEMVVVGSPALAAQYRDGFPRNLNSAPFLLPARNNALRGQDRRMVPAASGASGRGRRVRGQRLAEHLRPARPGPVLRPRRAGSRGRPAVRHRAHRRSAERARAVLCDLERPQDPAPGGRGDPGLGTKSRARGGVTVQWLLALPLYQQPGFANH